MPDVMTRARDAATPLTRAQGLALAASGLGLVAVCYGLARFAYGLHLPVLRAEFGLSAATAGLVAAGSYVAYCAAILVATALTPWCGGRVVAVGAGCAATLGTLTVVLAPNGLVLALGVVVGGASTGAASPALAHVVAHRVVEAARGRAQSVVNSGTAVGVAVAGPVTVLTQGHWRAAWVGFALLSAAVTLWAARAVPDSPASRGTSSRTSSRTRSRPASVPPRPALPPGSARLLTAAALTGLASAAVWTFGRDLLVTEGGQGETASTLAWTALGVAGVAGALAGDLTERFGTRACWSTALLVLGVATAALAVLPGSVAVACLAMACFGAVYIGSSGLLLLWGTRVHAASPATGVGTAFLALALGQAAGSVLLGALAGATTVTVAFVLAALLAGAAALVRPPR